MRLVYLIYDYTDNAVIDELEIEITRLINEDDETIYFSPLHAFGWQYGSWDFSYSPDMCVEMMKRCDSALVITPPNGTVDDEMDAADRAGLVVDIAPEVRHWYY